MHNMKPLPKLILTCLALALICAWAFFVNACSKREAQLSTGEVLAAAQVQQILPGFAGDTAYATVRSEGLPVLYQNFRDVLNKQGLVHWDSRYDCNHFAALFVALSQAKYTVAAWHGNTKAQTLALAEVWYRPGAGAGGHAIVAAVTERGLLFLEPQTGKEIPLTAAERRTIYLCKW
jgi:hypothetical protein